MADVVLFDINGTLLDLAALDPHFERWFGSARFRETWFEQVQTLWLVNNSVGTFEPFDKLADAALLIVADREGVVLNAAARKTITDRLTELPPFPDVARGLARLMAKGIRLAVLTNGSRKAAVAQLQFAKLHGFFGDRVYSAEEAGRYKPAPEPYQKAAEKMGVRPLGITLVAAHGWDTAGAKAAGFNTVFIRRARQALTPGGPTPGLVVATLEELAEQWGA